MLHCAYALSQIWLTKVWGSLLLLPLLLPQAKQEQVATCMYKNIITHDVQTCTSCYAFMHKVDVLTSHLPPPSPQKRCIEPKPSLMVTNQSQTISGVAPGVNVPKYAKSANQYNYLVCYQEYAKVKVYYTLRGH